MTITGAAREVLRRHGKPLTVDEILESIVKDGLFEFKAKDPRGVLRKQLRRHTHGLTQAEQAPKYFSVDRSGRYTLAES